MKVNSQEEFLKITWGKSLCLSCSNKKCSMNGNTNGTMICCSEWKEVKERNK